MDVTKLRDITIYVKGFRVQGAATESASSDLFPNVGCRRDVVFDGTVTNALLDPQIVVDIKETFADANG